VAALRVGGRDPGAPSSTWPYELEAAGHRTRVRQRFTHGPGFSYLRAAVERQPDDEELLVERRAADLAAGMRTTLRAAAALLAPPDG
jgi:hypothetical protein